MIPVLFARAIRDVDMGLSHFQVQYCPVLLYPKPQYLPVLVYPTSPQYCSTQLPSTALPYFPVPLYPASQYYSTRRPSPTPSLSRLFFLSPPLFVLFS
eukprot:159552-Rhodomonas_salina.1